MEPPYVLGVIPARGGSKRLPRKNLRPLGGEPLIVHTIRAAAAARNLSGTLVSTDDEEIASVACGEGAEVLMRPAELADDAASTEGVLLHVLDELERRDHPIPVYVVTLEPTSPLRTPGVVDACIELALEREADSVVTVVEDRDLFGRLDGDRYHFLDPVRRPRSQREPLYREVGLAYVTRSGWLREARSVTGPKSHAIVVPPERAVDVNTAFDLVVAEASLAALQEGRLDA